jgi:HSP20 family molecular chaperone IbpA
MPPHFFHETAPFWGRYHDVPAALVGPAKPLKEGFGMNRTLSNSPLLLGFEHIERLLERNGKAESYPPYNIEHTSEDRLRITLAVAGFSAKDLSVTVEDRQLVVRGRLSAPENEKTFLHRGIAARPFQRSFVLADGLEVLGAELDRGLLTIDLERPPADNAVRTIPIRSPEVQLDDARDHN